MRGGGAGAGPAGALLERGLLRQLLAPWAQGLWGAWGRSRLYAAGVLGPWGGVYAVVTCGWLRLGACCTLACSKSAAAAVPGICMCGATGHRCQAAGFFLCFTFLFSLGPPSALLK